MRCIDADVLEKEGWSLHRTVRVDNHTMEYETKPIAKVPTIEPERKKDTIQKFHDYQVEWLKSHYDLELEPQLEEMIIRFLHDTANRYMMEEGEQE